MPFINLKTNVRIKDKTALKSKLGEIITIIPRKTEAVTMMCLDDEKAMYFSGSDEPCAYIETRVSKNSDHTKDKECCMALIEALEEELKIPHSRIYALIHEEESWFVKKD